MSLQGQVPDGRVGAWIGTSFLASEVSNRASVLAGAEVGLTLGDRIHLGGAGHTLLGNVELPRSGATPLDLSMGYGGVVARYLLGGPDRWSFGAGLLAGGGTARVRDPVSGAELGSDNFVVLEPRLEGGYDLHPFLRATLSLRFRAAMGVNDLPGVDSSQIRGFGAAISLYVGALDAS